MKHARLRVWVKRALLFVVPALVGAAILIGVRKRRMPPTIVNQDAAVPAVRVITIRAHDVEPRALGYGVVAPARVWEAVAEVSGKTLSVHPRLKQGAILPAGTVLIEIDRAEYELQVAQLEANIESLTGQVEELAVREEMDKIILTTEQRSLQLKEHDLARQRTLREQDVISEMDVEREERNTLTQKLKVHAAEKAVRLAPSQRRILMAKLAQAQAQLAEARIRLTHTTITTPFECRIATVQLEQGQFVSRGQVLASADGIDVAEVHAQFPADELRLVIGDKGDASLREQARKEQLGAALQVSALVRFRSGDFAVEWEGRFARISDAVDSQTRTMGVIIEVQQSYARSRPGIRPPLVKGMHCEVQLRGQPRTDCLIIPRHTLRGGNHVLLLDDDGRLRKRAVQIDWFQGTLAVIRKGLTAGDILIVSDVVPAIEGMRVEARQDVELAARLAADAAGGTPHND